jgi:hypothetical protein
VLDEAVFQLHASAKDSDMAAGNKSLRFQVEKLVGSTHGHMERVRLMDRSRIGNTCRVRIQIERPTGSFSLFFFRHADGTWHVFPPDQRRPEMGIARRPDRGASRADAHV